MLDDRIEWIVVAVLLVALAVMTAAMFIGTAHGAAATACRSVPDRADRQWWSWRLVNGKRCYYRGRPGRDRAALRWEKPMPEPELAAAAPAPVAVVAALPVMAVPDLPVVPVQQQLASYQLVRLAAPPLSLPPLPYPRPRFLEPASPWWLLAPVGLAVALRFLFVSVRRLVRRRVWGSV
jgi:hypothetical protein